MKKLLLLLMFPFFGFSQGFTSYFTGNATNITTATTAGTCLMGGATEHDNAMRWLLQKANGGDVVVLRSTGSNGYNNYLYSDLGVTVNSVETLVITSIAGATNPYVLNKVANAEMIWFAGGDQFNYVSFFKNNALEDLLNNHINLKNAPIGGTSAGMAILCGNYFSAQNGTVASAEALANPYNNKMTLGANDFLNVPYLDNVTTDTHFDYYDRKGRLTAFLGKRATDTNTRSFGISANEYVAICIDENGKALVFGDYPNYEEFAFFAQANCGTSFLPETCVANQPLTWNQNGEAVMVYKIPGTMTGTNSFELSDWYTGFGGSWEYWRANNGVFSSVSGTPSQCVLATSNFESDAFLMYPNPFENEILIEDSENTTIKIYDSLGHLIIASENQKSIKTENFISGIYNVLIIKEGTTIFKRMIKK
jgi:cyanophycinase-like exopeptidase